MFQHSSMATIEQQHRVLVRDQIGQHPWSFWTVRVVGDTFEGSIHVNQSEAVEVKHLQAMIPSIRDVQVIVGDRDVRGMPELSSLPSPAAKMWQRLERFRCWIETTNAWRVGWRYLSIGLPLPTLRQIQHIQSAGGVQSHSAW